VFWFSLKHFSEIFHILRIIQREIITYVQTSSCTGVLTRPYPDQDLKKRGSMSGTWAISTTSSRELSSSSFSCKARQGKGKGNAVPLQAWSGPKGSRKLRFPDFMTTAQDGGKFSSLTHRPPLPPRKAPGTHFFQRLSRPQGHSAIGRILGQGKIPVTPAGIEPATFRFVAQHLNHCATAVPCKARRRRKFTPFCQKH